MNKEIRTSVRINAAKEKVWQVLTDFEKYPEWNTFITSLSGEVKEGKQIRVKLPGMIFKPVVLKYKKNSEFRWLGHLVFKGLFDGEHKFLLIDNDDGTTTFEQSERFSGILVRLLAKHLDSKTKSDFGQMNREIKLRVETVEI
nr:SRPBCC domain-containing protein [uncultured Draconibacterium sp.]